MTGEFDTGADGDTRHLVKGAFAKRAKSRKWLFGPHDISGACRNGCVSDLIVQALGYLAVMDEAIGTRKDIGSDPDERVILTGHDDRPRIEV